MYKLVSFRDLGHLFVVALWAMVHLLSWLLSHCGDLYMLSVLRASAPGPWTPCALPGSLILPPSADLCAPHLLTWLVSSSLFVPLGEDILIISQPPHKIFQFWGIFLLPHGLSVCLSVCVWDRIFLCIAQAWRSEFYPRTHLGKKRINSCKSFSDHTLWHTCAHPINIKN